MAVSACGNNSQEIGLSPMNTLDAEDSGELLEDQDDNELNEDNKDDFIITVYICGAVNSPGVYEFSTSDRVTHAIERAGGFSSNADTQFWNLAQLLTDGEKIYIPTVSEVKGGYTTTTASGASGVDSSGKININTATKAQLMTLTGVGEAKALSIISYRETNGSYATIEDVMKISGIKDAVFNTIKDYITV